jgi:superfamily II RNA helicase
VTSSPTSAALNLEEIFPFQLDKFQLDAIASLNAGRSVVVCAPTGSGKTLIGEYAIYRALHTNRRVFYTTPLKALSNQKWRDFGQQFGSQNVGLLTGDTSINRDAPILVMTTEIFRNMLYGTPIGEVGTSLVGVEAVVLDECHYMNDRQRGTVWEESIIYCPKEIQLVALSATVANSQQLTDWISEVHGPTDLIYSDFRPIPLEFYFGNPKGVFPLLSTENNKINPRLKPKPGQQSSGKRPESPSLPFILNQLRQREMLPAIYFIFSRRGCDQAVAEVGELTLVNETEQELLKTRIDEFLARYPEAARVGQVEPLYRGIAAHHAGILPTWKGFVEELFQEGLIKVVFATETLAAGINMPARTTVISTLSKRTDRGHRLLTASEFLQMAGRAGRRGMDKRGYVVTLQTPFEGAKEAAYLATSKADPLVSQFTPSYGMVLNLLQTHTLEEAKELIERSFGQYLATLHLEPNRKGIQKLQKEVDQLQNLMQQVNPDLIANYEKLQQRLKAEKQLLKTLQQQSVDILSSDIAAALPFAVAGTVLSLKGKHVPVSTAIPAVLVNKKPGPGQTPYLICLGKDNRWYVVSVHDVVGFHAELPRLSRVDNLSGLPPEMQIKFGSVRTGTEETEAIARSIPVSLPPEEAPEVAAQHQRVKAVEAQLENHPILQWGNPGTLIKRYRRLITLQTEINLLQEKLAQESQRHWEEFLELILILQSFGCLDELTPTPLGQAAAAIRGDNELWLGLALMSGELDDLGPHHLAAAAAALVTETPRPDSESRYITSEEVQEALSKLRGIRRQLFQVQRRHNVALPVWLEDELIGLVEQWALGIDWVQLCENTTLDEGDVVRMLRRTLDFLSQIPHVPNLPDSIKRNASRALQLMDRFPVNEIVG